MRKKVVVKLTLTLKEETIEQLESVSDLLGDIVQGGFSWGGQREPYVDPLFYPYEHVRGEVREGGDVIFYEVDTNT